MRALYRTYRPQTFAQLVGQEHVSVTLLKGLQTGKISHAFLFIGPRGTGKTSAARILAKALNCEKSELEKWGEPCGKCDHCLAITEGRYLDLIEIDAASNRGIDEIRDLREKIKLAPTMGKFKVYIIDEVHMLTTEAFNALLKTLEEPPPHAVFVLCTTEPRKIPTTIRSRCQLYEFKIPSVPEIVKVLEKVASAEKRTIGKEVLESLAKKAKGAYRDALVLLEKYLINGEIENDFDLSQLASDHYHGNSQSALERVEELIRGGVNPKTIAEMLLEWNRKALLLKLGLHEELKKEVHDHEWSRLEEYAQQAELALLKEMIAVLTQSLEEFRYSPIPQLPLELALVSNDSRIMNSRPSQEVVVKQDPSTADLRAEKDKGGTARSSNEKTEETGKELDVIKVKAGDTEVTVSTPKSDELKIIQTQWIDLLRKLRPINHSLEALLRSSEPVEYHDGSLTLKFFYQFHKERVEDPKNRTLVEKVFHEETGLPISLKLVLSDAPKPITKKVASQTETPNVKIVEDKDIPEAALDIFTN